MTLQRHSDAESHCEQRPAKSSAVYTRTATFDTSGNLQSSNCMNGPCPSRAYPTSRLCGQWRSLQPNCQRFNSLAGDEDDGTEPPSPSSQHRAAIMCVNDAGDGSISTRQHHPRSVAGSPVSSILQKASAEPPITKSSLCELDLVRIINDPKLRHDLNFEPEVAFRPNYDGSNGKVKQDRARLYWDALTIELTAYFQRVCRHNHTTSDSFRSDVTLAYFRGQEMPWRLPQMIRTVADILKTLVPETEHPSIERTLDVDLVMQQLEKGVMDFVQLGEWLGILLKGSCSPQRDICVSEMVDMIQSGIYHDNPRMLIGGIEKLFGVLEMMKLVIHVARVCKYMVKLTLVLGRSESPNKVFKSTHGKRHYPFRAESLFRKNSSR